jgi:hypothetical protein
MTEDQQREAFEAWAAAEPRRMWIDRHPQVLQRLFGQYRSPRAELAWEAWQAACRWANPPDHPPP